MQIAKIALMSSALILGLGLGGCSSSDTTDTPAAGGGTLPGNNIKQPGAKDPVAEVSSLGIYMAESNESTKKGYEFYTGPLYIDSKLYTRLYRPFDGTMDAAMKVVAYDLSSFNADMNISEIPTEVLYNQVGPNFTNARFNQRYYDMAEVDSALYFSTMPENIDTLSQSSYIKYDMISKSEVYHQRGIPVEGKNLDKIFDLARGWFMPFGNNNYMGVVEDAIVKAFNISDGSFYKYGVYDYLGMGANAGSYGNGVPPVGTEDRFYSVSSKLFNVSYLSNQVDYGVRDFNNDPEYKVNDILTDFLTKYSGSKVYKLANYNGDASGAISPLVIDDTTIYLSATLAYDDSEGYRQRDLYLMEYDKNSQLQEVYLLGSQDNAGFFFDATHTYKYGDNLYFKFRLNNKSEFCSYNLNTHTYNYKIAIGNHSGFSDSPVTSYAITGGTVVIPEIVRPSDYDPNDSDTIYDYDFVFKVINIVDGSVIKTLHHKDLMGLTYNSGASIKSTYVDENGVYFIGSKWTRNTQHNIIVKIDSVGNTVDFSRYRVDARHTGVITNR